MDGKTKDSTVVASLQYVYQDNRIMHKKHLLYILIHPSSSDDLFLKLLTKVDLKNFAAFFL